MLGEVASLTSDSWSFLSSFIVVGSALDCGSVLVVVGDVDVAFSWGPPKRSFQKYDHILPSLAMV